MGKWGYDQNETFNIASGGLTLNFEDNLRIANAPTVIQFFLYVDYSKGNETELQIRVEESFVDDDDPNTEQYFQETIVDNAGLVELYTFRFTETGKYRIPFQLGESEDRVRVSARGEGAPAFTGEVKLYFGIR